MTALRTLLSFLTFFGGHLLNRRLDRVVVMFAALATVGIASYFILPTVLFGVEHIELASWMIRAPAALIVATAIVSAALTWVDARIPPGAPLTPLTTAAGAVISALVASSWDLPSWRCCPCSVARGCRRQLQSCQAALRQS